MAPAKDSARKFIENIPASVLRNFPSTRAILYSDDNFHLVMKGITTGPPVFYNIQMKLNSRPKATALKRTGGSRKKTTVSGVLILCPPAKQPTPEKVRNMIMDNCRV